MKCSVCGLKFEGKKTSLENPMCYMCKLADAIDNPRKKHTTPLVEMSY